MDNENASRPILPHLEPEGSEGKCPKCGRRLSREIFERSDGASYRVCSTKRCLTAVEVES
jgi:hypothetical protein